MAVSDTKGLVLMILGCFLAVVKRSATGRSGAPPVAVTTDYPMGTSCPMRLTARESSDHRPLS